MFVNPDPRELLRSVVTETHGVVGAVALLAELIERGHGARPDAGTRAAYAVLARSLREACLDFRGRQDLLAYRRDWGSYEWHSWLDSTSGTSGTELRSALLPLLRDAGCSRPEVVLDSWADTSGQRLRDGRRGCPAPDQLEAWLDLLRSSNAAFADSLDVEHWLIRRGFPRSEDPATWLQQHKPRLPGGVRPLIADYSPRATTLDHLTTFSFDKNL